MEADRLTRALIPNAHLVVAAAMTTDLCRAAQQAHGLTPLASVALGRLLTATALAGFVQERSGSLSIQVLAEGRLGQLFADVTDGGHVRGYVKNPHLSFPLLPGESGEKRRSVAHAVRSGTISVIRTPQNQDFSQSATPLLSGEIDTDVASFLEQSDQIPTALAADVVFSPQGAIRRAAGVVIQAMPGADREELARLRGRIENGGLAALLATEGEAVDLIDELAPDAQPIGAALPLGWKCRCSRERVLAALRMLGPLDLAEMVQSGEDARVRCDFCAAMYRVSPVELSAIYEASVKARG